MQTSQTLSCLEATWLSSLAEMDSGMEDHDDASCHQWWIDVMIEYFSFSEHHVTTSSDNLIDSNVAFYPHMCSSTMFTCHLLQRDNHSLWCSC